jgi:cytoskeletal protein RodZ
MYLKMKNQLVNLNFIILVVLILLLIGVAGAWIAKNYKSSSSSGLSLANKKNINYKNLNSSEIANLRTQTDDNSSPQPASATELKNSQDSGSTVAPQANPQPSTDNGDKNSSPTSATSTSSQPTNKQILFSDDGCSVTVFAAPGTEVEIGAHTETKGGTVKYVVPESGKLTKSTGGSKGMNSHVKVGSDSNAVYNESDIKADQCAPAG